VQRAIGPRVLLEHAPYNCKSACTSGADLPTGIQFYLLHADLPL
jgi:hypothetical protein